jgi:hypothetical protein
MIIKFTDLLAIAPYFQPPIVKKTNLSIIRKKEHLIRKFKQVYR